MYFSKLLCLLLVAVKFSTARLLPLDSKFRTTGNFYFLNPQDGSYHYAYNYDENGERSYKEEKRSALGVVSGAYGYVDKNGRHKNYEYIGDDAGFRSWEIREPLKHDEEIDDCKKDIELALVKEIENSTPNPKSSSKMLLIGHIPKQWSEMNV